MICALHTKIMICMLCYFNNFAYSLIVTTANVPFWFLVVCSSGVEGGRVGEMVKGIELSLSLVHFEQYDVRLK
jgi:hypothetical protein